MPDRPDRRAGEVDSGPAGASDPGPGADASRPADAPGPGGDRARRRVHDLTVEIDRTLCVGFGDCVDAAPEAFELDGEDVAVFRAPGEASRRRLLEACAACPVDAITVRDRDGRLLVP